MKNSILNSTFSGYRGSWKQRSSNASSRRTPQEVISDHKGEIIHLAFTSLVGIACTWLGHYWGKRKGIKECDNKFNEGMMVGAAEQCKKDEALLVNNQAFVRNKIHCVQLGVGLCKENGKGLPAVLVKLVEDIKRSLHYNDHLLLQHALECELDFAYRMSEYAQFLDQLTGTELKRACKSDCIQFIDNLSKEAGIYLPIAWENFSDYENF